MFPAVRLPPFLHPKMRPWLWFHSLRRHVDQNCTRSKVLLDAGAARGDTRGITSQPPRYWMILVDCTLVDSGQCCIMMTSGGLWWWSITVDNGWSRPSLEVLSYHIRLTLKVMRLITGNNLEWWFIYVYILYGLLVYCCMNVPGIGWSPWIWDPYETSKHWKDLQRVSVNLFDLDGSGVSKLADLACRHRDLSLMQPPTIKKHKGSTNAREGFRSHRHEGGPPTLWASIFETSNLLAHRLFLLLLCEDRCTCVWVKAGYAVP